MMYFLTSHFNNYYDTCDDLTIVDVRGFLFAITTQQPKSTTCFSTTIVSELAVQSTKAKPTMKNSDTMSKQFFIHTVLLLFRIFFEINHNKQVLRDKIKPNTPVFLPSWDAISKIFPSDSGCTNTWHCPFNYNQIVIIRNRTNIHTSQLRQAKKTGIDIYLNHQVLIKTRHHAWADKVLTENYQQTPYSTNHQQPPEIYYHQLPQLSSTVPANQNNNQNSKHQPTKTLRIY